VIDGDREAGAGRVVVNAINLTGRGGESILCDFLQALDRGMPAGWTARAHVAEGVTLPALARVEALVAQRRWNAWADRIWFELAGLAKAEADSPVEVFVSLQGASARLRAGRSFVYCHQNLPLAPLPLHLAVRHRRFAVQRLVYALLYRFAIAPDDVVIVQQDWTRTVFCERYGRRDVIVARPIPLDEGTVGFRAPTRGGRLRILAPLAAFPNKDVETAIETARRLAGSGVDFEMSLTIDGTEGAYGAELARAAAEVPQIRLVGLLSRDAMEEAYASHQLMLFPSRIESWGLPLSEGKRHGIGIVATDHPYAREAVGTYDGVAFFPAGSAAHAAAAISAYWTDGLPLGHSSAPRPPEPFAESWDALVQMMTSPGLSSRGERQAGKDLP
jgi:glycosyltransferase involved in cell wall biosynthesis